MEKEIDLECVFVGKFAYQAIRQGAKDLNVMLLEGVSKPRSGMHTASGDGCWTKDPSQRNNTASGAAPFTISRGNITR